LRAIETTDVKRRLAKLEQEAAANNNPDGSPDTAGWSSQPFGCKVWVRFWPVCETTSKN